MRLHQVLTGAANVFENNVAVSVGNIDGRPFTAYGSGYDVAVLDGEFQRVQVLSECTQNSDCIVRCITCSDGNGKIAASFGNKVFIFEPEPISTRNNETNKRLPYSWSKVHTISSASEVYTICLDRDGKRLLIGSQYLNMWRCFSVLSDDVNGSLWENVWSRRMPTPVRYLDFSPDGHYFASAGTDDRMIKIWFQASRVSHGKDAKKHNKGPQQQEERSADHHHRHYHKEIYNFIYILHPKAVTGFSWRQKSKQMPLTCVLNVLLTSCADNVCRIWAETVKQRPSHFTPSALPPNQTQPRTQTELVAELEVSKDVTPRDSSVSLVDMDASVDYRINASFHRYHVISMYHFHLASVINPTADIALLSTIPTGSVFGKSFQLQWLNNKEIQFTTSYELLMSGQLSQKERSQDDSSLTDDDYAVLGGMEFDGEMVANEDTIMEDKDDFTPSDEEDIDSGFDSKGMTDSRSPSTASTISFNASMSSISNSSNEKTSTSEDQTKKKGIPLTISAQINQLLRDWCTSGDTLFCIHPVDGSLLIWLVDYLDDFTSAFYRQPQVSFASRIPAAFTKADASSLNWTGTFYYKNLSRLIELNPKFHKSFGPAKDQTSSQNAQKTVASDLALTHLFSLLVSAHSDGTLNLWQLTFSDVSNFTGIASVTHLRRNCGPRFATSLLATHPILPLVISTSQNSGSKDREVKGKPNAPHQCVEECASELMLWRSDLVGPLSQLGGVTETSRISSNDMSNFKNVAWFPHLFEHSLVSLPGPDGTDVLPCTPCACFVTSSENGLHLHQVVLDSKTLLSALTSRKASATNLNREKLSELIESEQSGSKSTCVMPICDLADSDDLSDIKFLHVFTVRGNGEQPIEPKEELRDEKSSQTERRRHQSNWGPFYIVAISASPGGGHKVRTWVVQPLSDRTFSPVTPISTDSASSQFSLSPVLSSKRPHSIITTTCIETRQICQQELPIDTDQKALLFSAATDIPSSSCQNVTCPASFWLSVASSDNFLRFFGMNFGEDGRDPSFDLLLGAYNMNYSNDSKFKILAVAHAHSYRLAWMSAGSSINKLTPIIMVTIIESESTGGETWRVEDTIELPYKLPANVTNDLSYLETLPIGLTWMSLENGAFILSAALGNSIYILYQARTLKQPQIVSVTSSSVSTIQWKLLNTIDLQDKMINTITWTRDGMLLVGVKNELRVYSQWEFMKSLENLDSEEATHSNGVERNVLFSDNILYKAANATAVLPQYHPKHLIALMNLGKMRRVRAILCHLVRCVAGRQAADEAAEAGDMIRTRSRTLSRTHSTLSSSPMESGDDGAAAAADSSPEIDTIPPLPLNALMAADKDESGALLNKEEGTSEEEMLSQSETDYSSLFDSKPGSIGAVHTESIDKTKGTGMSKSAVYFGLAQAQLLAKVLTKRQLPGLNSINQLYLLAIADTVATTNLDLESGDLQERGINYARRETHTDDKLSQWAGGGGYATTGAIGATAGSGGDAVDDCGLKFLLAMRQHTTLLRSLPLRHRASLEDKGLPSAKISWAFHSDCQEELLAMVPCMLRGEPNWKELKAHGAGWWVKSSDTLKRLIEKLAKAHFQVKQDPLDCAIFYLAMKKKTLLCALFRSLRDTKMSQFFGHDFKEERWRKAALKNAYALLGKQRFEHAAAFFLLADALWDAVQVCISKLKDLQLALVISRLYEGDIKEGSAFYRILSEHVLGESSIPPQQDPFIRSMTYWLRCDYRKSLETLLLDPEKPGTRDTELNYNEMASMGHPDIFNFYMYLRSHPYVRRCHLSQHSANPTKNRSVIRKIEPGKYGNTEATTNDTGIFAPNEREIVYRAAHTHLNSGMPSVALEVLMLLPKTVRADHGEEVKVEHDATEEEIIADSKTEDMIVSGTISDGLGFNDSSQINGTSKAEDFDWSKPVSSKAEDFDWSKPVSSKAEDFDWSKPVSSKAEEFDWSKPVSSKAEDFDWSKPVSSKAEDFDWSKPVSSKAENFDWSAPLSSSLQPEEDTSLLKDNSVENHFNENGSSEERTDSKIDEADEQSGQPDIASLHLKYITVFKCLIEELRSLPSTCTLDGVKLRPTVAYLLERELEVLHKLCDYGLKDGEEDADENEALHDPILRRDSDLSQFSDEALADLTGEKKSLSQKAELLTKKIQWLRRNETILTTLYNCCALQGVGGENLPAICLELLFLLHELEHYRSLAAPLHAFSSGQTVPPLLLATMTTYSLFANPVTYLRNMTHDILRMLLKLPELPTAQNPVNVASALESLSLSLSSCIFHSLCGGHEDQLLETIRRGEVKIVGKENKEGKLVRQTSRTSLDVPGSQRKDHVTPTSLPSRWPGVQMLSSILAARNKEGSKSLKILLCESAIAVYVALLVTSSSQFLPNQLYRLVLNQLSADVWGLVFGGGTKLIILDEESPADTKSLSGDLSSLSKEDEKKRFDTARMKWNFRLLGKKAAVPTPGSSSPGKYVQQELFIPPQMTLYDYFLKKPLTEFDSFEYNSQDSFDTDEDDDYYYDDDESEFESDTPIKMADNSHINQMSYSWRLMTFCVLKIVFNGIMNFLTAAGLEISELPSLSPLLYSVVKLVLKWQTHIRSTFESRNPPENFLPINIADDDGVTRGGPTLQRMKLLMDPNNTPFRSIKKNADPAKRLWHSLVYQESLRDTFLELSFPKDSSSEEAIDQESRFNASKIIYKDADLIMGFNFNNANRNALALAAAHEVVELDVSGLTDIDINVSEELNDKPKRLNGDDEVQSSRNTDRPFSAVLKRCLPGVRRMESHPSLPYYVTGGNDGSVRMFEFGHPDQILSYRGPNIHDRVNRIRFNTLGNKFGACDDSGYLSLWTLTSTLNPKPYAAIRAYSRQVFDFAFLGSSSLIATAGYSSESKTVCMWDTLMSSRRSLVHSFIQPNHSSQAVYYIPGQQCLLSGGRRGNICIFDIRQRKLLHTFQAHDSTIKCFAVDPSEEFFVSGSADGDIKVWGLAVHELYDIYKRDHLRGTYLRHGSTGVQQLQILPSMHLMSCGSDGTLKIRPLRTKDPVS